MSRTSRRAPDAGRLRRRRIASLVASGLAAACAIATAIPLIWILAYVFQAGAPALSVGFLTSLPTPVGVPGGGIANAIVGSAITVGVGLLVAAPIGIAVAIYVAANPHRPLGIAVRFSTDTLAGVPSIVMGIFVYTIVVRPAGHFSALAGAVVLGIIMLPIVIRTTEEMIKLVPTSLREGSLALGAPEWRTSMRVILPAAASGILTGLMLAVARAAGEAAPMLFTAFGNPFFSTDLNEPIATLPHTIFVYAISPYADWQSKAWATAFILISLVLILNIVARVLVSWRTRRLGTMAR